MNGRSHAHVPATRTPLKTPIAHHRFVGSPSQGIDTATARLITHPANTTLKTARGPTLSTIRPMARPQGTQHQLYLFIVEP
jgi:hypothetical protein